MSADGNDNGGAAYPRPVLFATNDVTPPGLLRRLEAAEDPEVFAQVLMSAIRELAALHQARPQVGRSPPKADALSRDELEVMWAIRNAEHQRAAEWHGALERIHGIIAARAKRPRANRPARLAQDDALRIENHFARQGRAPRRFEAEQFVRQFLGASEDAAKHRVRAAVKAGLRLAPSPAKGGK
jgi:hypothetical protein